MSCTGLTNRRITARSERGSTLTENPPPPSIRLRVTDPASTETATNFGAVATCITQLQVIRLRRRPARLPTTNSPVGIDHSTRRRIRSYSSGVRPTGTGPTAWSGSGIADPDIRHRPDRTTHLVIDHPANGSPPASVGFVVEVDGMCPVMASMRPTATASSGAILRRSDAERRRSAAFPDAPL